MTSKLTDKFKLLFEKIKKIKHIQIYLTIGLAVIVAIIFFMSLPTSNKSQNPASSKDDNLNMNFSSSQEYTTYLENKLENVLSEVKGAGNVNVVITLEKGFEYVYATEEETRTTSNGTTVTTTSLVLVDGNPVLQEEIYPLIKGVVLVCQGADDISTKMNLLSVVQTVIDIDNSKITIISGK